MRTKTEPSTYRDKESGRVVVTQGPFACMTSGPQREPRFVYFIRNDLTGLIEIGSAQNVANRLRGLTTTMKTLGMETSLCLLAQAPGDYDIEKRLHRLFDSDQAFGEWFRPSSGLLEYVNRVATRWAVLIP